MRKTYIIDTSVLIYDPYCYQSFHGNNVVIPVNVLDELDKLKTFPGEIGRNARVFIRALDKLCKEGEIHQGVKIDNDIVLKIDTTSVNAENFGTPSYVDNKILGCAYNLIQHASSKKSQIILVSKDINLRIRARAFSLKAEDYEKDRILTSELYAGAREIVNKNLGEYLLDKHQVECKYYLELSDLHPNECLHIVDEDGKGLCLARKVSNKLKLIPNRNPWDLELRNKEQAFAVDLIMDPNVPLVSLVGKSGGGKTLVAMAAALELVMNKKAYNKLIVYKPIQPIGNDLGSLPGPQPLDAKILTPNGWITMGEIKPGDYVIGSDGQPKRVLNTFPKGRKQVYKVFFSDGSMTECCDDHLWFTKTEKEYKDGKNGKIRNLKEIRESLKKENGKLGNHRIDLVKPVEFQEQETLIDPYILGVLLGDGTLSEKSSVYFSSMDEQIVKNCQNLLPESMLCKVKSSPKNNKSKNYSIIMRTNLNNKFRKDNIFAKELKNLGLTGTTSYVKFIPEKYKFNSFAKRLALLQGLMDTDGFVSKEGDDISFSTTSYQLAKDVKFLVQSLGGISRINLKNGHYKIKGIKKYIKSFVVSLSFYSDFCPFKLDRKANRYKSRKNPLCRRIIEVIPGSIKETQCILIESEDHLYVTDDFILTHNTLDEKLEPWMQSVTDSLEFLLNKNKKGSPGGSTWRDKLSPQYADRIELDAVTYVRGRSIPNALICIDEAQNLKQEEIKTVLTRVSSGTKILVLGDIEQLDAPYLDATNNGLTYVVEKFKDSDLAGHITFTKGERSPLATLAANIL